MFSTIKKNIIWISDKMLKARSINKYKQRKVTSFWRNRNLKFKIVWKYVPINNSIK